MVLGFPAASEPRATSSGGRGALSLNLTVTEGSSGTPVGQQEQGLCTDVDALGTCFMFTLSLPGILNPWEPTLLAKRRLWFTRKFKPQDRCIWQRPRRKFKWKNAGSFFCCCLSSANGLAAGEPVGRPQEPSLVVEPGGRWAWGAE